MKAEIQAAVKTAYLQYGLKAESIEKIVNTLESRLSAVGTIPPEELSLKINEQIELYRPVLALIQSEVDFRAKPKTTEQTTAATTATTVASTDEPEWAKALRLQVEGLSKEREVQQKATTRQELIANAKKKAAESGATNQEMLNDAMRLIEIKDDMTTDQASALAISEYNRMQSSYSKDGAVPVIPALGDKATVEAAQKKGVELVDKFLGKPKTV